MRARPANHANSQFASLSMRNISLWVFRVKKQNKFVYNAKNQSNYKWDWSIRGNWSFLFSALHCKISSFFFSSVRLKFRHIEMDKLYLINISFPFLMYSHKSWWYIKLWNYNLPFARTIVLLKPNFENFVFFMFTFTICSAIWGDCAKHLLLEFGMNSAINS